MVNLVEKIPIFNETFNIVVHAAGLAHYSPKKPIDFDFFHKVNVTGTRNLLKGLENSGRIPQRFIYISSVAVYGRSEGILLNESTELKANDPFGKSKIQAERLILNWCEKRNVICTILRLPLVIGLNPPGNLGDMVKGIRKGYYFNISGGTAKKSMVLASDVSEYIIKASKLGGVYNLTDGYHPSFFELSNTISQQLGKSRPLNLPIWIVKFLAILGDLMGNNSPINSDKFNKITSNLTFDDSKAREAFGWDPSPVLKGCTIVDMN